MNCSRYEEDPPTSVTTELPGRVENPAPGTTKAHVPVCKPVVKRIT